MASIIRACLLTLPWILLLGSGCSGGRGTDQPTEEVLADNSASGTDTPETLLFDTGGELLSDTIQTELVGTDTLPAEVRVDAEAGDGGGFDTADSLLTDTQDLTPQDTWSPEPEAPVLLGQDGRTSAEVVVTDWQHNSLVLRPGTEVRLAEGLIPTEDLVLSLDHPEVGLPALPQGFEAVSVIRVGLRHGGEDGGGFFRYLDGDQVLGARLELSLNSGLQPGDAVFVYSLDPGVLPAGLPPDHREGKLTEVARVPVITGEKPSLELGRTAVYVVVKAGIVLTSTPENGFELQYPAAERVAMIEIYEPETAQMLANMYFSCVEEEHFNQVKAFPTSEDARVYWWWLEPREGGGETVHVVSPFANKPKARLWYCNETKEFGLDPAGPFVRAAGVLGAQVLEPYQDCDLPYDGHVRLEVKTSAGGYPEYRSKVSYPLQTSGAFEDGAYSLLYCDCATAAPGCDCIATVTTDRCAAAVPDEVLGSPEQTLGNRVASIYYPPQPVWTDPATQLMWEIRPQFWYDSVSWQEAMDKCETLGWAGHDDWRLPNIDELRTLVRDCPATATNGDCSVVDGCGNQCRFEVCLGCDYGCHLPDELVPDPDSCASHWSSSVVTSSPTTAWKLNFGMAGISSESMQSFGIPRCVRNGN